MPGFNLLILIWFMYSSPVLFLLRKKKGDKKQGLNWRTDETSCLSDKMSSRPNSNLWLVLQGIAPPAWLRVFIDSQREREREYQSEMETGSYWCESCKIYGSNKTVHCEVLMAEEHYTLKHWVAKDNKHEKKWYKLKSCLEDNSEGSTAAQWSACWQWYLTTPEHWQEDPIRVHKQASMLNKLMQNNR